MLKTRCIYGIRRLTPAEFQLLGRVKEDVLYVCGSTLFDFTSELAKICCVELNVNCNSDMSSHYYSCKKKFQVCCYVCGCFGDLVPITDERRRQFQSIHPICTECRQMEKMNVLVVHALLGKKGKTILIKHIYILIKHSFQYFKIIFYLFL